MGAILRGNECPIGANVEPEPARHDRRDEPGQFFVAAMVVDQAYQLPQVYMRGAVVQSQFREDGRLLALLAS